MTQQIALNCENTEAVKEANDIFYCRNLALHCVHLTISSISQKLNVLQLYFAERFVQHEIFLPTVCYMIIFE